MFSRKLTLAPEKIRARNELAVKVTVQRMLRNSEMEQCSYPIYTDTSKMHRKSPETEPEKVKTLKFYK